MFTITTPISAEDLSALLDKQSLIINDSLKFSLSTHTFRNARVNKTTRTKSMQVKEVHLTVKN